MYRARLAIAAARVVVAGVEAGADRRGAEIQLEQLRRRVRRRSSRRMRDVGGVAAELLAERDRHRILQMRAAGLRARARTRGLVASSASRQRARRRRQSPA